MIKGNKTISVYPPCLLCAQSDSASLRYEKNGHKIYYCRECHAMFVAPQPTVTQLNQVYSQTYFERGGKYKIDNVVPQDVTNELTRLKQIKQCGVSGELLDVGCATGDFLNVAREAGFEVAGVELSQFAAQEAIEKYRLSVFNGDLLSAKFTEQRFSIVTLWDVLEHLSDPQLTIKEVARILKPGGQLFFTTGDFCSLWAKCLGKFWQLLTPEQHLFYFSAQGIRSLLEKSGFEQIEISYPAKQVKLEFVLFKARETFGKMVRPLQWLLKPWNNATVKINLRDIMLVKARKR